MDQPPTPTRPATPGSWKPGQSGNPKGRPRSGLAFAERIRERLDPDTLLDLAARVAADETLSPERRLEVLIPLYDRGYIKPPTTIAAKIETTDTTPKRDWSLVSIDERRALLEQIHRVRDPKILDAKPILLPAAVAHMIDVTDEESEK